MENMEKLSRDHLQKENTPGHSQESGSLEKTASFLSSPLLRRSALAMTFIGELLGGGTQVYASERLTSPGVEDRPTIEQVLEHIKDDSFRQDVTEAIQILDATAKTTPMATYQMHLSSKTLNNAQSEVKTTRGALKDADSSIRITVHAENYRLRAEQQKNDGTPNEFIGFAENILISPVKSAESVASSRTFTEEGSGSTKEEAIAWALEHAASEQRVAIQGKKMNRKRKRGVKWPDTFQITIRPLLMK